VFVLVLKRLVLICRTKFKDVTTTSAEVKLAVRAQLRKTARRLRMMKNNEFENESKHLSEELKEVREWQERHTRVFCTDCRKEAIYNARTIDGFGVHSCEKHSTCWLGCKLTRRKVK
jgi:hypothetical protein